MILLCFQVTTKQIIVIIYQIFVCQDLMEPRTVRYTSVCIAWFHQVG